MNESNALFSVEAKSMDGDDGLVGESSAPQPATASMTQRITSRRTVRRHEQYRCHSRVAALFRKNGRSLDIVLG